MGYRAGECGGAIVKRQCKDCQEWFPETSAFFKPNKDKCGKTYLSHRCKVCRRKQEKTGKRESMPKPISPDLVLETHTRLCKERGEWATWRDVARELKIKYSAMTHAMRILHEQKRVPPAPPRKQAATNRDFIRAIESWLNRHNIGDRNQAVDKRLKHIQERVDAAVRREKGSQEALIASRVEVLKLRREIARLSGLRDGYRKSFELPAPDYRTADDGYELEIGAD